MIALQRRGIVDTYSQFSFTRDSLAYDTKGRLYHPHRARFEPGKFGRAVMVEERTTNLIPADQLTFAGWVAYQGASVTLTQGQAIPGVTADGATRIQTSGGTHVIKYYVDVGTGTAGTPASYGVWVYNIGTVPVVVCGNEIAVFVTVNPGEVKRCVGSKSAVSGTGVRHIQFRAQNAGDSLDFIAFQPQIEEKAYPTSFAVGTRSPETLTIPTAGVLNPQEGTVEAWFYVPALGGPQERSANRHLFAVSGNPNSPQPNTIALRHGLNTGWEAWTVNASGNGRVASAGLDNDLAPGWHLAAMRWSASELAILLDGVKKASVANPSLPSSLPSTAYIGLWANGAYGWVNTLLDDLRISSRARTDEEIAAAYASGQPLPVDEWTTCKLPFDGPDAQRGARVITL